MVIFRKNKISQVVPQKVKNSVISDANVKFNNEYYYEDDSEFIFDNVIDRATVFSNPVISTGITWKQSKIIIEYIARIYSIPLDIAIQAGVICKLSFIIFNCHVFINIKQNLYL